MPPPRRRLLVEAPGWAAFAWSAVALLQAHLYFFHPPALLNGRDEAYLNAFAMRMLDGRMLPYVDAVSHRGPVLYWMAALSVGIFGRADCL